MTIAHREQKCNLDNETWPVDEKQTLCPLAAPGAIFDLIESDRRSKIFFSKHNLVDPRFTPVGLCSRRFIVSRKH